jgi:hypothetical protein
MDEGNWTNDCSSSTVMDSSGNGFNGKSCPSTTGPSGGSNGKYGKAGYFDGVNDYVNAGLGLYQTKILHQGTYEAWVNPSTFPENHSISIMGGYGQYIYLFLNKTAGIVHPQFCLNTSGCITSTLPVSQNAWSHVAVSFTDNTISGTNNVKFYVNGVQEVVSSNYAATDTSVIFIMGSYNTSEPDFFYVGYMDDVMAYNYARTQAQIIEDMNAGHPAPGSPASSPLLHLRLDEGYSETLNNSGNGGSALNGNLAGSDSCPGTSTCPTWTNTAKFNRGLTFDGNNDYAMVSKNSSLNITGDLTLSIWVNPSSFTSSGSDTIIMKGTVTDSVLGYRLFIDPSAGSTTPVGFSLGNGSAAITAKSTSIITTSAWQHIAATVSGTEMKIYINGVLQGADIFSGTRQTSDYNLGIGHFFNGDTSYDSSLYNLVGSLDEVKIYNFALTADQVKMEYNQGKSQVLGALSTTSAGVASNSAAMSYCIPGSSDPCAAPVGEWYFDEGSGLSAYDKSGNNNVGTLTNGPSWTTGKTGGALSFDGTDDYIDTTDQDYFSPSNNDLSIELWAKIPVNATAKGEGNPGNAGAYFISKGGNDGFEWGIENDSNAHIFLTLWQWNGSNHASLGSTRTMNDGLWHHYAVTVDYLNSAKLFIDNILVDSTTSFTGTMSNSSNTVQIGRRGDGGSDKSFQGQIDQVLIYNYVRTPAQIAWDYNRGAPIAQYNFDECTGSTLHDTAPKADRSSTHYNGTITPNTGRTTGTCGSGVSTEMWNGGTTGKYSASLMFDGSGDYVSVADNASLRPGNGSWSVSLWAKPQNANQQAPLISKDNTSSPYPQWSMYICGDIDCSTTPGKKLYGSLSGSTAGQFREVLSTSDVADGNWHHFIMVADKDSNQIRLYSDGRQLSVTPESYGVWPTVDNTDTLMIGRSNYGEYFNGQIDEIKVYNYALTPAQVQTLYNRGAANFGP